MAVVRLDFIPPDEAGFTTIHVFEAATKDGVFAEIHSESALDADGEYISSIEVDEAVSSSDYFSLQWSDAAGAISPMSEPYRGDQGSLVLQLVNRMLLRDSAFNENIAAQEAEAVVSEYFKVVDPYTVDPTTVSAKVMSGLTNLALARAYLTLAITASSSANKWSAGIVSMDTSTSTGKTPDALKALIEMANRDLGQSYSVVLLLKEIEVAGGYRRLAGVDLTRAIYELQ